MTVTAHPPGPLSAFVEDDGLWRVVWPAALAGAILVHSFAFLFMTAQPAKPKPVPITMAISIPPPPPEPPPPPPEPPKPKKPPPVEAPPPPLPPAPIQSETPPPPDAAPPKASEEVIALGPSTGQGVKVAVGSKDGVEGAPPVTSSGPPSDVAPTNRGQSGPPPKEWDENGYKSGAWELMNKAKRYPRKAQVLGLEGKCMVVVKLNHDGSLAGPPKIFGKGTGHPDLDEECLAMATRTTFPTIPENVATPVTFRFPIEFTLVNR